MNIDVPQAPDAKDNYHRPIEFYYDPNWQGYSAWLIERISETEERRTRICSRHDRDQDQLNGEKLIEQLKSWAVFEKRAAVIGQWENQLYEGVWKLHDTPRVRDLLGKINTDPGAAGEALQAAWKAVFDLGFFPVIRVQKSNGDVENMRMLPHNVISVSK